MQRAHATRDDRTIPHGRAAQTCEVGSQTPVQAVSEVQVSHFSLDAAELSRILEHQLAPILGHDPREGKDNRPRAFEADFEGGGQTSAVFDDLGYAGQDLSLNGLGAWGRQQRVADDPTALRRTEAQPANLERPRLAQALPSALCTGCPGMQASSCEGGDTQRRL